MYTTKHLGQQCYLSIHQAMKNFTLERSEQTPDELWLLEHPAVFTQGQAGKPGHILNAGEIPIIQSDRGGQVTYHGPGQLIGYTLFDLRHYGIGIRSFVCMLEQSIIKLLDCFKVKGQTRANAPGVYIDGAKIASIGLRVRNHCTYHGIALNVAMDLEPFERINPCGFNSLAMTQLSKFYPDITMQEVTETFETCLFQAVKERRYNASIC